MSQSCLLVELPPTPFALHPVIILVNCLLLCIRRTSTPSIHIIYPCCSHCLPKHFTLHFPLVLLSILINRLSFRIIHSLQNPLLLLLLRFIRVLILFLSFKFSLFLCIENLSLLNEHFLTYFLVLNQCVFYEFSPTGGTLNSVHVLFSVFRRLLELILLLGWFGVHKVDLFL